MARDKHIIDLWPEPPVSMVDRLKQTLDVWDDYPDDFIVLIATSEVYGPNIRTGLTIGDLRKIHGRECLSDETVAYGSQAADLGTRLKRPLGQVVPPPE